MVRRVGEGLIKVLLPRSNTLGGQFKGTADAVYQYLDVIQAHAPDMVAVFAADHIYRMDVRQMVDFHAAARRDVTVAAVAVPLDKARGFGVLSAGADGRVREFQREAAAAGADPGRPAPRLRLDGQLSLRAAGAGARCSSEARERGEVDFGRDMLPRVCASDRVYAYDFAAEPRARARRNTRSRRTGATSARSPRSPPRSRTRWARGRASTCGIARWPIRGEYEPRARRPQAGRS